MTTPPEQSSSQNATTQSRTANPNSPGRSIMRKRNRAQKQAPVEENLNTATLMLQRKKAKGFALAGIFMSMFVAMLASTVVGTSMPVIMGDLGGSQTMLTWVVTATMLASAVSAPIWGKLADLTNKKVLLQLALATFSVGSMLAGFAHSPEWLVGFRVVQGLGGGGLAALSQIIMADIITPRERGKYMGIGSAVMGVATVSGPLLGGLITDTIGWRWNFFVTAPIALATLIIMQITLDLRGPKRKVKIDYMGAMLIAVGFSSLLLWISLGGSQFAWDSVTSIVLISFSLVTIALLVFVESRAAEPMIPLKLFKNRTFTLSSISSLSVGISMFSMAVFLGQFLQLSRGNTPLEAGLLTIPMIFGTLTSSIIAGQYVTRSGNWKRVVVTGAALTLAGAVLMAFSRFNTPYWQLAVAMFLLGFGVGMTMQNLVLVVQNTVDPRQVGTASANVTFFRTIGGTVGLAMMGAVVSSDIVNYLTEGFKTLGKGASDLTDALANDTIPKLAELPEPVRLIFEEAYGRAIGNAFWVAVPFAALALVLTIFLPNIPLGDKTTSQLIEEQDAREAQLRAEARNV